MSLSRIVMRLARNPGTELRRWRRPSRLRPDRAPRLPMAHLDEAAYAKSKASCSVRRFAPDEEAADGRLARKGAHWFFDYDSTDTADDEPVHRLGEHKFALGEYVTVTDEDGRPLTYKVMEVVPVA